MSGSHPWHRFILALVLPDAIIRHLHEQIVARIRGAGYEIAYFELLHVTPEQLTEMYDEQIKTTWEAYRYRLLDRLWAFGPTIGLVLEDVTGGSDDPHQRLKRLKGATDPAKAAPGTIRRDFGGVNAMLSFLHASDQPDVSVQESRMLFGARVSAQAPLRGERADGTSAEDAEAMLRLLTVGAPETRGFTEVLADHRASVIAAAWHDLTQDGRALAAAASAGGTLAEVGIGAKIADGLPGGPAHPAFELLRAEWQPGLPSLAERDLLTRCAGLGLERDAWAEIVLLTSAYFAPNR
jgi:nucleoside diphosphate kinase